MKPSEMDAHTFCKGVLAALGELPSDGESSIPNALLYLLSGYAVESFDAELLERLRVVLDIELSGGPASSDNLNDL